MLVRRNISNLLTISIASFLSTQSVAQLPLPRIIQFEEDSININLDGFVDEPAWQNLPIIDGMKISDPDTLEDAPYKTEIVFFQRNVASTLA